MSKNCHESKDVMRLLSYEHLEILIDKGGTHAWRLSRNCDKPSAAALACDHILMRINHNDKEGLFNSAKCDLPHGVGHVILKGLRYVPSADVHGRFVIKFEKFARIYCDTLPPANRNYEYISFERLAEEFGIDAHALNYEELPSAVPTPSMES